MDIENPKKFQRHLNDICASVLTKRGYYQSGWHSRYPFLKSNGIANIADFYGKLCYVKSHRNYNLIARLAGIFISVFGLSYWFSPIFTSNNFSIFDLLSVFVSSNIGAWILIGIGLFLIFFKFGKEICIEIKLTGESYRTNTEKEKNSIEYLNVRSQARLTIQASTLDPKKTLSVNDIDILREDGGVLTGHLDPFISKFIED